MTINHPTLSHSRILTIKSIECIPRSRHRTLLNTIMLKKNGLQIHGKLVQQFPITIINGVQGILVMITHLTKFVLMNSIKYLICLRNGEILVVIIENGSFYNMICTKPIEALKENHFSGFKAIPISSGASKFVIVDLDVVIPMNLLSRKPFHNVVNTKFVPLNPGGDLPKPPRGATTTFV